MQTATRMTSSFTSRTEKFAVRREYCRQHERRQGLLLSRATVWSGIALPPPDDDFSNLGKPASAAPKYFVAVCGVVWRAV